MFCLGKFNRKLLPRVAVSYFSTFDSNKDYFKILGVERSATDAQIKSAYYKLALKYHPDHNKGMETKFKEINEAYSVLSDPSTKKQYLNVRTSGTQSSTNSNTGYGYGNTGQNYGNAGQSYGYEKWQGFEEPYRGFQQRTYYEYDPNERSKRRAEYSSRSYYEDPYEAYEKFRNQQSEKFKQQYYQKHFEQMQRNRNEQADMIAKKLKFLSKLSIFLMVIFLGTLFSGRPAPVQYQYAVRDDGYMRHSPYSHSYSYPMYDGQVYQQANGYNYNYRG